MKKLLAITLIYLIISLPLSAQCDVENGNVENWTSSPFELDPETGTIYQNDVNIPDDNTSVIRLLFILFGSFGDPKYGEILESDPQGFIGIDQSTDASEGDFAVKLQGGYGIPYADIYSPKQCTEVPDSFTFDLKHVGAFEDTLTVSVVFDEGLAGLPQDKSELQNYPAYAYGDFYYNADTPYEKISLPVIENFAAPVDTFYYLIVGTTNDSSYFLIDNIQNITSEPTLCSFDNYPSFSLTQTDVVCLCDEIASNDGIEGTFVSGFVDQDTVPPLFLILNAADEILYKSTVDIDELFDVDLCSSEDLFLVQIVYENVEDISGVNIGNNLSNIIGCHAVSEKMAINTIYEEFEFEMNRNGVTLNDTDTVIICAFDDVFEVFSFSTPTNLIETILILDDETGIVTHQFHGESDLESLPPGKYGLGMIASKDSLPNYIGMELEYSVLNPCIYASENFYDLRVLDLGEEGCLTSTEDPLIKSSLQIVQNPVSEILTIRADFNLNKTLELSLLDLNGKPLLKQQYHGVAGDITFDVSSFASGVYLMHAKSVEGSANFKFIKQ